MIWDNAAMNVHMGRETWTLLITIILFGFSKKGPAIQLSCQEIYSNKSAFSSLLQIAGDYD